MLEILFLLRSVVAVADLPKAPIHIPIRGSLDSKDAKGTFFDHYVFQRATKNPTLAVVPDIQTYPSESLKAYVRNLTVRIENGVEFEGHILPKQATSDCVSGLLIIPGREREKEYDITRANHEREILRKALLRGQPVLCICAGAWRVWHMLRQLEINSLFDKPVIYTTQMKKLDFQ